MLTREDWRRLLEERKELLRLLPLAATIVPGLVALAHEGRNRAAMHRWRSR